MAVQTKLNLASNEPQELALPGGMFGAQQIVLTFGDLPISGTASVEVMPVGGAEWLSITKATDLQVSAGPFFIRSSGWISRARVTLTDVVGGDNAWLWVEQVELPPGLFEGTAAITTQPYTEANVKKGVQYYLRANWTIAGAAQVPAHGPIGSGESRKLHFVVGEKPIIVKLRDFSYIAEELTIGLYANPVDVTGGVPLQIHNYNGVSPVPTTVSAARDVTTASDGVEFDGGDRDTFFGASAQPQRNSSSIPAGRERILPPGGSYLVVISNTGTGTARAQYFLDWFEGESDLPL